jgi:hypothetical protein
MRSLPEKASTNNGKFTGQMLENPYVQNARPLVFFKFKGHVKSTASHFRGTALLVSIPLRFLGFLTLPF